MSSDRLTVSLPGQRVRDRLDEYGRLIGSPGYAPTLLRILDERDALMAGELRRVPLTEREADVLASILNGVFLGVGISGPGIGAGILIGEVLDAFEIARQHGTPYGEQFGIDEDALLGKLRGIGPTADLALREAFARWWSDSEDRDYASVGLRIISDTPTRDDILNAVRDGRRGEP